MPTCRRAGSALVHSRRLGVLRPSSTVHCPRMRDAHTRSAELVLIFGVLIYPVMGEVVRRYLFLGQMSYWGAQVIGESFGTVPASVLTSRWGSRRHVVSTHPQSLLRPHASPSAGAAGPGVRTLALHDVGSNNPTASRYNADRPYGRPCWTSSPSTPTHLKDWSARWFPAIFCAVLFRADMGGYFLITTLHPATR